MKDLRVSYIIDKKQLVLNVGSIDNLEPKQRFLIYGLSDKDIIDPSTHESLGRLEIVRGTGVVSYIQEKMCIIESDMYNNDFISPTQLPFKNPEIGDYARKIQ